MLLNQPCNNLKFSMRSNENNDSSSGILNQKPMIITKDSAYNFQVLDRDKLKLAQLLAKRDLKSLKEAENAADQPSTKNYMKAKNPKVSKTAYKPKPKNKYVTSISRIPGPVIPVPSPQRQRSPSPPMINEKSKSAERVRQIEFKKKKVQKPAPKPLPKPSNRQLNNIEKRMTDYSSKLDHLEALLRQQSQQPVLAATPVMMPGYLAPEAVQTKSRTREELDILTDKLQKLMSSKIPQVNDLCPPGSPVETPQPPTRQSEDLITRINLISARIGEMKTRYSPHNEFAIGYEYFDTPSTDETVDSVNNNYHQTNHSQNDARNNNNQGIRLTKPVRNQSNPDDKNDDCFDGNKDNKTRLFLPVNLIQNLDDNRKAFARFQTKKPIVSLKYVDWAAEDMTNDIMEKVMMEFDKASAEVINEVIQAELTPGDKRETPNEETRRNMNTMDTY